MQEITFIKNQSQQNVQSQLLRNFSLGLENS